MSFTFSRVVHYYETDAMGVVHHSNYLRWFEEARVALMRSRDVLTLHQPYSDEVFAVLETHCQHWRSCQFEDQIRVQAQVRWLGPRVEFQYRVFTQRFEEPVAYGRTLHILVDSEMKVRKPPKLMREALEQDEWSEGWASH